MQKKDEYMTLRTPEGAPLERQIQITVPAAEVDAQVTQRLRQKARSARLPGFRPGKVPPAVIQRQFGSEALMEAFDHLINQYYVEALRTHSLRPVARPEVQVDQGGRGEDLIFTATVEVYPDFTPVVPEAVVTRKTAEILDSDVDATLDIMRQQRRDFVAVDRPAQSGDRVTVDFIGRRGGEVLPGGDVSDYGVVLGSGRLLPEIEQALEGLRAGDEKQVEVTFPADYPNPELAGQKAEFALKVKAVAEPRLPELDADFARELGIEDGDVATLRREVRENLEREAQRISRVQVKAQILDLLVEANQPELPKQLLAQERERLKQERKVQELDSEGESLARRRVVLGLVLSEIARQQKLVASASAMDRMLRDMAEQYEDPEQFVRWYRQDEQRLAELEAMVLEDQVVEWLLERVKVSEVPVSFNRLIGREPEPADVSA
ncbi:trigger factor [Acidithiobacillus caldus]|uniref:Trigger factor n=4 Tax=Acidithiobacillus caldus TaxID=33059 RepID=F9ZNP8_ACICS|nr:Cell division trigger factor [Acidithiobacillus caldus SM-1]AUW32704.1 trigger factor [Acidithiobacillus caldus]MBU2789666.1 trigger factor [Acidithiobacillus caldus]MBU2821914.1 trigger factor [Acidithiobacillus caldus]OFC35574.1 trigger factor [Acidithiobacillus caldus]